MKLNYPWKTWLLSWLPQLSHGFLSCLGGLMKDVGGSVHGKGTVLIQASSAQAFIKEQAQLIDGVILTFLGLNWLWEDGETASWNRVQCLKTHRRCQRAECHVPSLLGHTSGQGSYVRPGLGGPGIRLCQALHRVPIKCGLCKRQTCSPSFLTFPPPLQTHTDMCSSHGPWMRNKRNKNRAVGIG